MNPLAIASKIPLWAYAVVAGVAVLYVAKKGGLQNAAAGATVGIINGAGNVVMGTAQGVVIGAGQIIGIPAVTESACKKAIMNGDNSAASFHCSAGVFAKWQYLSARQKLTGKTFTMSDIFG